MIRRRGKFGNVKVAADGFVFDSKKEYKRYCELLLLLKVGHISGLTVHPAWAIILNDIKVCRIVMDFSYTICSTGETVVEDVKGVDTPISKLKRKLLEATYSVRTIVL